MKGLSDRLSWIQLYLSDKITDPPMEIIAKQESLDCYAIAEVLKVDKLTERLEYVRDYLAGAHNNKAEALEKLCEAMAIADVLPEIQVTMPEPGFI